MRRQPLQPLLDQRQVATLLGVSTKALERWRLVGKGPKWLRCGRLARYRPEDLEAWIEAGLRQSTSDPGREAA